MNDGRLPNGGTEGRRVLESAAEDEKKTNIITISAYELVIAFPPDDDDVVQVI